MKLKTSALTLFASVCLLAACGNTSQEDTNTSETTETTSQETNSNDNSVEEVASSASTSAESETNDSSSSEAEQANSGAFISEDEAWQVALDDAGTNEEALIEREIELDDVDDDDDDYDDVPHYEIEFTLDDGREFEYDIDATTGNILNAEVDQ